MSRSTRLVAAAALALGCVAAPAGAVSATAAPNPIGDTTFAGPSGVPPWLCRVMPRLCDRS